MAVNKKLTELTELTTPLSIDENYIVNGGASYRISKFNYQKIISGTSDSSETITPTRSIYIVDTTGGAVTLQIDATAKVTGGMEVLIKDDGNAGTNNIIISLVGGGTIDGAANYTISANYGFVKIYSDGTDALHVIGEG